jgi:hypothetical protein
MLQTSCDSKFEIWAETVANSFVLVSTYSSNCTSGTYWPVSTVIFSPEISTSNLKLVAASGNSALCEIQVPQYENVVARKKFFSLTGNAQGPISAITDGRFDDKANTSTWPFSTNSSTFYLNLQDKPTLVLGVIIQAG